MRSQNAEGPSTDHGGGPFKRDLLGGEIDSLSSKFVATLQDDLDAFRRWRAELSARGKRLRLRAELVGVSPEAIIAFAAEVETFGRALRIWRGEVDL
ncbi:MAG: hypothetical protein ACLQF1_07265 [Methyloceanibacter sp.]